MSFSFTLQNAYGVQCRLVEIESESVSRLGNSAPLPKIAISSCFQAGIHEIKWQSTLSCKQTLELDLIQNFQNTKLIFFDD